VECFDHEHYLLWTAANAAAAHEKLQSHPRRTRL
jgi:hypothetical protein